MTALLDNVIPTLHASSPHAAAIAGLLRITLALCAAIFVLVAGLVAYVIVRYCVRPGAPEPSQESGNTKLEIA